MKSPSRGLSRILCHVFGLEALAHEKLTYVVHVIDTPPQRARGAGVVYTNKQGLLKKKKVSVLVCLLYKVKVQRTFEKFYLSPPT